MARVIVASVPLTGHVQPLLPLVAAVCARGHDVRWYAARKFERAIAATGAVFAPMHAARDWDDRDLEAAVPALRGRRGIARVKTELRELFIAPARDQLRDLDALADAFTPDVVIADSAHLGAAWLAERRGTPCAGVGVSALMIRSVDTAPFGPGWAPATTAVGHARNRLLAGIVDARFRDLTHDYHAARGAVGLPAGDASYFDALSPDLYLQPTIAAFEYPRSDLPRQIHFIGPLVPRASHAASELPVWWPDVVEAHRRGVPIVVVTQGTMATDVRELIAPTLRALAAEPVLVIATTARTVALEHVPANARVAAFVPYQALLPMTAAFVTNAGYGGVQMAMQHGVPIVAAGGSEEKPEIAARVAWSGVGIDLRTGEPPPAAITRAVRRVLADPRYRDRAAELAHAIARTDAPTTGADLIDQLIATRAPVLRA